MVSEKQREYARKQYRKNIELNRERGRAGYYKHREKRLKYMKQYQKDNKE